MGSQRGEDLSKDTVVKRTKRRVSTDCFASTQSVEEEGGRAGKEDGQSASDGRTCIMDNHLVNIDYYFTSHRRWVGGPDRFGTNRMLWSRRSAILQGVSLHAFKVETGGKPRGHKKRATGWVQEILVLTRAADKSKIGGRLLFDKTRNAPKG